jgi:hypothetical protein
MGNITLGTTLGTPTGTGKVFKPFKMEGDLALFKEQGATGRPAVLSVKRVLPKATKTSAGVERGEIKLTEYVTVGTEEHVVVTTINTAIPVPVPAAQRTAQATRLALIAGLTVLSDLAADQTIPQA